MSSALRARLRPSSLRARLILWYLLMLGGALLALALFVFALEARSLQQELDSGLQVQAHQFAADRLPALLSLDPARLLQQEPRATSIPVAVRHASGGTLFRSPAFPELDWAGERTAAGAVRAERALVTASDRAGHSVRIATRLVTRPGAETLAVQVAAPTTPVRHALGRLALGMILFVLLVLAVASYGGSFIARRALAPVDDIVRRVQHIQAAQLRDRLDIQAGSAELDRLVSTLNEMLGRIEASMRSARRFAADASHELQTPIAAMRCAVEMCLRAAPPGTDQQLLAADLLTEMAHVSTLIRDLRLLALADGGQLVQNPEPVDLGLLAKECCEIAQSMAEEKQIRVDALVGAGPTVTGSPLHLRRAVLNLLQNAIRYSPASSRIVMCVGRANGSAFLSVLDHGCGIAPSDLPHVFEPFYRADPARARDTGGTGLGLAIVDQIVRLHGGEVRVATTPGKGATFVVYLPSTGPAEALALPAWTAG